MDGWDLNSHPDIAGGLRALALGGGEYSHTERALEHQCHSKDMGRGGGGGVGSERGDTHFAEVTDGN